MWSAQPSILIVVTIMLDDYCNTNPGVQDLPWLGIDPQSPSPQPVVIAMSYYDPNRNLVRNEKNYNLTCQFCHQKVGALKVKRQYLQPHIFVIVVVCFGKFSEGSDFEWLIKAGPSSFSTIRIITISSRLPPTAMDLIW